MKTNLYCHKCEKLYTYDGFSYKFICPKCGNIYEIEIDENDEGLIFYTLKPEE